MSTRPPQRRPAAPGTHRRNPERSNPAGTRRQPDRPRRRLVGLAAAAAYADISTRTLRRYISHGRLTGYRVGPRLVKIDLNELDELARPIPAARDPGR